MPFSNRGIDPLINIFGEKFVAFTPQFAFITIENKLENVGRTSFFDVPIFFGLRLVLAVIGFAFGIVLWGQNMGLVIGFILFLAGFIGPHILLDALVRNRKQKIISELPHAVNLLWICTDAGLSLRASIKAVYESWDSAIASEFGRVSREVELGMGVRESLNDMANRLQLPQVTNFVTTVTQGDVLGTSLSNVLRSYYNQLVLTQKPDTRLSGQIIILVALGITIVLWGGMLILGQILALL